MSVADTNEVLNKLNYGTIFPSILPSILIYGISYARYGCVMLDIMLSIKSLINKLQLLDKLESSPLSASVSSVITNSTGISSTGREPVDSSTEPLRPSFQTAHETNQANMFHK